MNCLPIRLSPDYMFVSVARYLPWLLPLLLLFSRAVADITVVLTGLLFIAYSYTRSDWAWAKQSWFRLAMVFWAYLLFVNLPLSVDSGDSLKYAFTFIRWPLFAAALAYWIFADNKDKQHFLLSLLVVSAFVIADTGWQYVFGVDWFGIAQFDNHRLTGPFRNPVPGTLMLRVWFISLFAVVLLALFSHPYRRLWGVFGIVLLGMGFMFITGERMALMLYLAGAITALIGLGLQYREQRFALWLGALMISIGFASLVWLAPVTAERSVHSIFFKLASFADSDYGHVFAAAWQSWLEYPLFGSGIHTYQQVCEQMGILTSYGMACTHPHNLYLQLAAETGLIGLGLFVLLLVAIYRAALKPTCSAKQYFTASLSIAVLTVSFWPLTGGISVLNNWIAALVWLGVGWVLAVSSGYKKAPYPQKAGPNH